MLRPSALAALVLFTSGIIGCAPSRPAATAPADARFTDGDLLGVFVALNRAVLLTSQVTTDADDPELRDYAVRMAEEHQAVVVRSDDGVRGVTPQQSQVSRALDNIARANADRLGDLRGPALDSAFVRTQVALHRQTLDWLDFVLIPQASPALAPAFEEARPLVSQHLEEIWAIHNLRLLAE